ncbi:MAG TPA: universal stress protein [Streptosporangiaceae bacterium]|nr:universal stress protein [Streptosporangiaceae bacterium]
MIALNIHAPFFIAVGAVAVGIVILTTVHHMLAEERVQAEQVAQPGERIIPVPGRGAEKAAGVVVAAVDGTPIAAMVAEAAARIAAESGQAVHVVHPREAAIGGDVAVDREDLNDARALARRYLDQLAAHRVPADGQILLHATDHGAAGRMIAEYGNGVAASTVVIGAPTHGGLSAVVDGSSSRELLRLTRSDVFIVNPAAPAQAGQRVESAEPASAR